MDFRGHALIWHSMAPKWLENEDSNSMKNSIVNHITNVLKHYEGKIDTWDVVNEAIDDSSNGNGWKMRNSFLYQKVPNFIDLSFQTARKVSPKTKLFYNDYNTEGIWGKSESVYQFIADLKKRNIPIDGVGLQYHVSVQHQPQFNKINDLIGRYCKLGVEVHITELDVSCVESCYAGDVEKKQSDVFTNALKACLGNSCCTGFLVWGIGD
ncbi:putative xylanase B, partial [Neocallimastix californiae]